MAFPPGSPFTCLDALGRDLPSLFKDRDFRAYARTLKLPLWPSTYLGAEYLPLLRLYCLRLGFLASGYVNQVRQIPATRLPANIAIPLCHACRLLGRPPVLSDDGYVLYNWRRLRKDGRIVPETLVDRNSLTSN